MIRYTVTLTEMGDMVAIELSAPPGHASAAEIRAAELFRQKIIELQEQRHYANQF